MQTIEMRHDIPDWAKQTVSLNGHKYSEVQQLHRQGRTHIQLPDVKILKGWAKAQNWPTPWFGFQKAFINKLFETDESFRLALNKSGVKILVPIKQHTLTIQKIKKWDVMYAERQDMGALGQRPTDWGRLVTELREMRRLIEAGVKLQVEETQTVLSSWQGFYDWAHGRYRLLEDGHDSWMGDDK